MNVLIAAGGTGGHIYPALAVAEKLETKGDSITWIGSNRGVEQRVIAPRYPLFTIDVKGFSGNVVRKLMVPWYLAKSLVQCNTIFRTERPDVVFSTGGYVSLPVGVIAKLRRIPLVLHESNAVAGVSNKILAKFANVVLTAFEGVLEGHTTRLVGTPVRAAIDDFNAQYNAPNTLGVVGGSLGAQVLNEEVPKGIALIEPEYRPVITHQSGKDKLLATKVSYDRALVEANIVEYIDDMVEFYTKTGLLVCRAGALTVTELTHVGIPAILVPYPYAASDHQTVNAGRLAEAGAAQLIPQDEMTPQRIAIEIKRLMENTALREEMSSNLLALAQKGVAEEIAGILIDQAKGEAAYA